MLPVASSIAQERVAMPPVQPSARGVTTVNDCETRLAKMNQGSCPQACMERQPREPFSLTTSAVCDLANAANWECRWPRVQVPQNGLNCPTGWNGTYDVMIMNESRNCGAQLVEIGRTVVRSGCTRTRVVRERRACPTGWSGTIRPRFQVEERLNLDLRTFVTVNRVPIALTNNDVSCSRRQQTTSQVTCPNSTVQVSQVNTTTEWLAADLISVARSTSRNNYSTAVASCPPPPCNENTPGAWCAYGSSANFGGQNFRCAQWVCGSGGSFNNGANSSGGGNNSRCCDANGNPAPHGTFGADGDTVNNARNSGGQSWW